MGLFVLDSLGFCCQINGNLKLYVKERFGVNEFLGFTKLRIYKGAALRCSKREVAVEFLERTSPHEVREEIQRCYELIHRLGRGVIYLGSARIGSDHPHYSQALELSREIANLLNCTTWSGGGPGLMDAVTKGAMLAGKPVGAFKIGKEADGEWQASSFHPYLPSETYLTCRFFSARKHGLVDAAVRSSSAERTAVVTLPGGVGTLDEMFEILALIQLQRLGSALPVPFLVMNYDLFYTKLFEFIDDCENWGTVSKGEVAALWRVCNNNTEAISYLTEFYNLQQSEEHEQRSEFSRNMS